MSSFKTMSNLRSLGRLKRIISLKSIKDRFKKRKERHKKFVK